MPDDTALQNDCFTTFQQSGSAYPLPERFTYPFCYEPHPLALVAAQELQQYIETQKEWTHDFGLIKEQPDVIIGKMFGVLVVQNQQGEVGYLSAFSGKLADSNHHASFVPPVFDMLHADGFMREGMDAMQLLNIQIKELENQSDYLEALALLQKETAQAVAESEAQLLLMKHNKAQRDLLRKNQSTVLTTSEYLLFEKELSEQSIGEKIQLKNLKAYWQQRTTQAQTKADEYYNRITNLKKERKTISAALQKRLFQQYQFLNKAGVSKSLHDIFDGQVPVGGSGECAAPKLLHYAFQHHMKPLALAEFWWGQSPKSEIRKHRHFYPACQDKCKPILAHMLEGIPMDVNPLLENPALGKDIRIIYENEYYLVINKPTGLLSAPGKHISDSVATRMKARYPDATGPLIVHRLDMATSGLMLIAKSLKVHHFLQSQFMKRTIKKKYEALLDGIISEEEGLIDLPIRVDLTDRPRQLVCYEYGRPAQTRWKVIERKDGKTRIHFFPITGRSHQLRVHAAHALGLGIAIVGDDLYGQKADRLCLHAGWIGFKEPVTREWVEFEVGVEF